MTNGVTVETRAALNGGREVVIVRLSTCLSCGGRGRGSGRWGTPPRCPNCSGSGHRRETFPLSLTEAEAVAAGIADTLKSKETP